MGSPFLSSLSPSRWLSAYTRPAMPVFGLTTTSKKSRRLRSELPGPTPQRMPWRHNPPWWLGTVVTACRTTLGCLVFACVTWANHGVQSDASLLGVPVGLWYHATSSTPFAPAELAAYTAEPFFNV